MTIMPKLTPEDRRDLMILVVVSAVVLAIVILYMAVTQQPI